MRKVQRQTAAQMARLTIQLKEIIGNEGVQVEDPESLHNDLQKIVTDSSRQVEAAVPVDSFQKLFWEQQKKAALLKNSQSMRWHPLMIKWCIYLKYLSRKVYETIRDSGCVALPSQRTLRDYTHCVNSTNRR